MNESKIFEGVYVKCGNGNDISKEKMEFHQH